MDKDFASRAVVPFLCNSDSYNASKPLADAPNDLVDDLSRRYIMLNVLITGEVLDSDAAVTGVAAISPAVQIAELGANVNGRVQFLLVLRFCPDSTLRLQRCAQSKFLIRKLKVSDLQEGDSIVARKSDIDGWKGELHGQALAPRG